MSKRIYAPGDRVYVTDPALAQLRAIFAEHNGGVAPSNHHGTVDEVSDTYVYIVFDDGGSAPYPPNEVRLLV